jgi:hypothetical protein
LESGQNREREKGAFAAYFEILMEALNSNQREFKIKSSF